MKKELKMRKKTALILILVIVSSVVLWFGIKDELSRQGWDCIYVASTPAPERASVWDVFDDKGPDADGGESLPPAELKTESVILDSDLVRFDDRYASCDDRKTDLWLVGEGLGIFGDLPVYRYDAADSRWKSFTIRSPDEVRTIKRHSIQSGDMLHIFQWNNGTWEGHSKERSTLKLGSEKTWFNEGGADCYARICMAGSSISAEDESFSYMVSGGTPPIGGASSFEPELLNDTHSITLAVTAASGGSAEDAVEVKIT